jgi:hypothetical protein
MLVNAENARVELEGVDNGEIRAVLGMVYGPRGASVGGPPRPPSSICAFSVIVVADPPKLAREQRFLAAPTNVRRISGRPAAGSIRSAFRRSQNSLSSRGAYPDLQNLPRQKGHLAFLLRVGSPR